jgi:hypothetical protein
MQTQRSTPLHTLINDTPPNHDAQSLPSHPSDSFGSSCEPWGVARPQMVYAPLVCKRDTIELD